MFLHIWINWKHFKPLIGWVRHKVKTLLYCKSSHTNNSSSLETGLSVYWPIPGSRSVLEKCLKTFKITYFYMFLSIFPPQNKKKNPTFYLTILTCFLTISQFWVYISRFRVYLAILKKIYLNFYFISHNSIFCFHQGIKKVKCNV